MIMMIDLHDINLLISQSGCCHCTVKLLALCCYRLCRFEDSCRLWGQHSIASKKIRIFTTVIFEHVA